MTVLENLSGIRRRKEATMNIRKGASRYWYRFRAGFLAWGRIYMPVCLGVWVLSFSGCAETDHKDERGLVVLPAYSRCPSFEEEYRVWVFDQKKQLLQTETYQGRKDLASSFIRLSDGGYYLVLYAGTDSEAGVMLRKEEGVADSLYFSVVSDGGTREMYYGSAGVVSVEGDISMVSVPMCPFWARLSLRVEGLPESVARVEVSLQNAGRGVYPFSGKIEETSSPFLIGEAFLSERVWEIDQLPTPPSVGKAVLKLVFYSSENQQMGSEELLLDEFAQGGNYSIEARYGESGFSLVVVSVEGWESGEGFEGEAEENK